MIRPTCGWDNGGDCYQVMRCLITATAAAALLLTSARPAQANAYSIGMQWCQMVRNGMDASEAWKMIVNDYARAQPSMLDRGDPYAPWSPTRTWSGAIGAGVGAGIADGIMAAFNLNSMKSDIIKTTDANCPEYGLYLGKRPKATPQATDASGATPGDTKGSVAKDLWCIPWAEDCTKLGVNSTGKSGTPCHKTIEKFQCSYKKYLVANPAVESWAKANPAMAKKEAIRLGAIDAEEIALPVATKADPKIPITPSEKSVEDKCLKAVDYKGCMEYNIKK